MFTLLDPERIAQVTRARRMLRHFRPDNYFWTLSLNFWRFPIIVFPTDLFPKALHVSLPGKDYCSQPSHSRIPSKFTRFE